MKPDEIQPETKGHKTPDPMYLFAGSAFIYSSAKRELGVGFIVEKLSHTVHRRRVELRIGDSQLSTWDEETKFKYTKINATGTV